MNIRKRNALKAVAAFLVFAIAQVYVQVSFAEPGAGTTPLPIPQQLIAKLAGVRGGAITVNGNSATTGASIITGATIETGADQAATINLGSLGSLDIAPNTRLVLTYDENGNVKVTLVYGCAILRTKKKTTGEVATEQGTAGKTNPIAAGILDICFPPGAAGPVVGQGAAAAAGAGAAVTTATTASAGGLFGLGVPATVAIIGGIAGAVIIPIVATQGQGNTSGSTP